MFSLTEAALSTQPPRYSPNTLERRMMIELGRFDSIDEAIVQLGNAETTQKVAMAQQDTVTLANILQVRFYLIIIGN